MNKIKRTLIAVAGVIMVCGLCACEEEVITVADMQVTEEQTVEYIEIQEFELKELEKEPEKEAVMHCAVMIPAGYYPSEEIPGMYIHKMAPLDSSNVYYSMSKGDGGIVSDNLTEQEYKEELEQAFAATGQDIIVTIEAFEAIDMDGVPAYKVRSTYETGENKIQQLTYMILGEDTHTVTYSQSEDDELFADFEVYDGVIRLVTEQTLQMADTDK